ncbi:MAG: UDP-N-acetylmuramoyl-L-alanine--D-glutamate ligase [Candidatus Campbellbacteria bacterium]|nr:UDP-N-acetylmuramoyl-L-alanine--D-glutamate ligase [Candidatus Campbellbacteria bacterium]
MDKKDYFKDKKITVMGLGLLGRGVGDVEFLAQKGADLTVTDIKTEEELAPSLKRLQGFNNIKFVLSGHRFEDFQSKDLIIKGAGVPLDSPYIEEARKNDIPVEMSTALFADLSGAKVVGVTGTRGKTTVAQMIFRALESEKSAGHISKNIFLGGNLQGVSTLAYLNQAEEGDIAVLELDSWQLQGFRSRGISPHISVFTTFMPDHMDYYKNDMEAYFFDKSAIYANQKTDDILIIGSSAYEYMKKYNLPAPHKNVRVCSKDDLREVPELSIAGDHNRFNARLALEALYALGVDEKVAKGHIVEFVGVSGRLEKIRVKEEITFFNDTTATTPEAAIAALDSLKDEYEIILIAGGSDKGLDIKEFAESIKDNASEIVLLSGKGTERLQADLAASKFENVQPVSSMKEAVEAALSLADSGTAVVLSPGFASFGMFKNEFDRGEQFREIINKL